jgi:hypothetical protein
MIPLRLSFVRGRHWTNAARTEEDHRRQSADLPLEERLPAAFSK